jgi:hypothetical protein
MVGSSVFATAALTSGYGESLVDEEMNKKEEGREKVCLLDLRSFGIG